MKIQRIGICTNNYLSIENQQSNAKNPNFGKNEIFVKQGPDLLGTLLGENAAKKARLYVDRWTQFLARKGAATTFERSGDRLAISVSSSEQASPSGHAITDLTSWKDVIKALAKASHDYLMGNDRAAACARASSRHKVLV